MLEIEHTVEVVAEKMANVVIVNEVLSTEIPLTMEEKKILMMDYKRRHPEQFFGTREWEIMVNSQHIGQVGIETGIWLKST